MKCRCWTKRNFASRCFALAPLIEDEKIILKLIDDPVFLVRCHAATAALRLPSKLGVEKVIRRMSFEPGYPYYFYRDLLIQGSQQVCSWIDEIAVKNLDSTIRLACTEILVNRSVTQPFLTDFKNSIFPR